MARDLQIRLACAAALLATGLAGVYVGARLGVVQLEAGEMTLVFGGGEQGLTMGVASRVCPPHCSFNIDWRPSDALAGTGF